ncbi:uncharacterized protein LOC143293161 [Babylonia areolata]|uniref:uncharacterized protein LOC143293161 n=1 Tax=Babylonia areolata TaxID=304850 RepID=UPI003FD3D6BA
MAWEGGAGGGGRRRSAWQHQRGQWRRTLVTVLLLLCQQLTVHPVLSQGFSKRVDVPLDCQEGWTQIGAKCYRLFKEVQPWDSADLVCQSYGSQMLKVKDFYENEAVGRFVDGHGTGEYWMGVGRQGTEQNDARAMLWSDGTPATVAVGYWQHGQPDPSLGQCVLARLPSPQGRVVWAYAPCERKSPYVCQRSAAPKGSFHCHNGHFVRQGLACDGEDDCGDGSDEINCNNRCSYHVRNQQSGTIISPNSPNVYPNKRTCRWLIEVQLGYNVKLEFTAFRTEARGDEVLVLAGGKTVSTSRLLGRLSGDLSSSLPSFTSNNNFLTLLFSTDDTMSDQGFKAQFSAVKADDFPSRKLLTATDTAKELTSPLYPGNYLSSQDYTWIVTAEEKVQIVTLQILEVDLKGEDRILIRDGDMVFHDLLAELTSSSGATPPYVLSTGRDLYISMQTRSLVTGKGFKFRYWQGCSVSLNGTSGEVHSPGYVTQGARQYGAFQTCTYDVTVPGAPPVTLQFNSFRVHVSDRVLVYEGGQLRYNITGTSAPAPFVVSKGAFRLEFQSDAIQTDEGFSLTYSVGCPNPQFNDKTIVTPSTSDYSLGTRLTVSCHPGYAFSALEFRDHSVQDGHEALRQVVIQCQAGGTWGVGAKPVCEPRYCGQPESVTNAYIVESSGVTYQATVRFQCYPGFAMQGQDTVTCTDQGQWTTRPTCLTAACPSLPETIGNGQQVIRSGDGTEFSSVVEYVCVSGYQIVGTPVLFCGSDGRWTANVPRCQVLTCHVPSLPNGVVERGGQMIGVGESVTATCQDGYVSNMAGGGSASLTCLGDRTLQGLDSFTCTYRSKCQEDPDYCQQLCQDSEFQNRTCSCLDGYTLNADLRTCANIDECANNSAGCDHTCTDISGGYQCSCDPGFVLFSYNGVQGHYLAHNEDGHRPGDVRRFNHTCLPVKCPDPPVVEHGQLMVDRGSYHYGDYIEYRCGLGYQLSGSSLLACDTQGQWDKSPPRCDPAVCLPDTVVDAQNPAVLVPTGQVQLGHTVTLTCHVPGMPVFSRSRQCVYQQGRYQLVGGDYDCGFIDCGAPDQVSGSVYGGFNHRNTTFGASFQFSCQNLYTLRGSSEAGDTTVRCLTSGTWDFGSLRCEGMRCTDPGSPPNGRQVNTTSYNQGDLVHFRCDQDGFSLSDPYPLTCRLNNQGTRLEWNGTLPACVDTEKPVLTGCVNETVAVPRYARADTVLSVPTASDNVYVSKLRVTDPVGAAFWPSDTLVMSRMTVFYTNATDHAGNTAGCVTTAAIIDDVPPTIECPLEMVREFTLENEVINVVFSPGDLLTLTDNMGTRVPVFTPPEVTFTSNAAQMSASFPPFQEYDVTATVQDLTGNPASCTFQLLFRPEGCSPFSLRTPVHGRKSCTAQPSNQGFTCQLSCDQGYVFHHKPASSSITYSCNRGDSWNVPDTPACVQANDTSQHARFRQTFRFTYTKQESGSCPDLSVYRQLLEQELDKSESYLPSLCNVQNPADRITGQLAVTDIAETGPSEVQVNITLTYDRRENKIYEDCQRLVQISYENDNFQITAPFRKSFNPLGCPGIRTTEGGTMVDVEYFCPTGKMIKYTPQGYQAAIDVCVSCPEGTRIVGSMCELCPQGTYSPTPARPGCLFCDPGTSTYTVGAVSKAECTGICGAGTYSSSGLPPCRACPKNTYSADNSTYCTPCPDSFVTRNTGSTSPSQCLAPCPPGTYNTIDGHGDPSVPGACRKCPINFYSSGNASRVCTECSLNQRTVSEASTSLDDCIEHTGCNVSNNPCQNNGQCNILNHDVTCTCQEGYNGRYCEYKVGPCSSSPCYFGGRCNANGDTYTCDCNSGTSGTRCEVVDPACTADHCLNGGVCRNDLNSPTCLCPPGFSGQRCELTQPICQPNPCQNGGQCVSLDNVRFRCDCALGFQGFTCEKNIDECQSSPCLHGGNCTDVVNGFQCSCPKGFSGSRCEQRRRLCDSADCGEGTCVEDHLGNTFRCVCPQGAHSGRVCQYEAYFGYDVNGSAVWVFESSNATIGECMAQCEARGCTELLYDNVSSVCRVVDPRHRLSVHFGRAIYYYRVCKMVEDKYWTPWYDSFFPSNSTESGDDEMLASLTQYGLNICGGSEPVAAECQVVGTRQPPSQYLAIGCTPTQGLLCLNQDQPDKLCHNYEVRFLCLTARVSAAVPATADRCAGMAARAPRPLTEASCSCSPGYMGSRCQHHVDHCASGPCRNNATCVQQAGGYTCVCLPGFGGSQCEADINDCQPNPCHSTGAAECVDLVNRYQCVCNPGFTGPLCQTEINECASQPCLHEGRCIDQVNNFTCQCASGWTGPLCEDRAELCDNSTCSNGATCYNLFNDFFCSCLPNTYGKACSNAPSICANANPCQHGATCSESQGQARCHCPPDYEGAGCETQRDLCNTTSPVCQHGATCTATLGTLSCRCPQGFTGQFCETNINNCQFNRCPAGSTCMDMVDDHFCRCPVGKSGENCEKDTDRQFDLLFSHPEKTNMAALGYPLRLTGGGFSITMWVQYSRKGGKGTFFTLYRVSEPHSLEDKQELIRLDDMGLTLSLDPSSSPLQLNTTVDYSEDGEWHYIVISWNHTTGLLSFFVDTIRIPLQDYHKGRPLDLNVWMVLGCRYDTAAGGCRVDEGFNGYVSQVSLYGRELLFKDELTVLGNTDPFYVFPGALMTWGEFLLYPGVTRVYNSKADLTCPWGFTGFPSCTTPVAGKTAVSVDQDSCPSDIIKYSKARVTQVTWPTVTFTGQVNQVTASLSSGTVFLWGKYPVVVEASNMDGNKALCTFDIYVQYDKCTTPKTPVNAKQVFCANFADDMQRDYRQCSVSCNPNFQVVVPSPLIHTCGPVGSWDPPNRYLPYTLPPCGGTSSPKRRLKVMIVYHVPSTECSEVSQEVREQTEIRLQQQNSRWSSGLCQRTDCSDIQLDITCERGHTPAGSQLPYSDIGVTVTANNMPHELTSTSDSSLTRSPEDLFQQLVLSDTVFDFSNRIAEAVPDPNGLDVQIELLCDAPTAPSGDQCVDCAAGSYYDAVKKRCALCPVGKYQPLSGQTGCADCTPGTTTETAGSSNSNQCKRVCATGQYYNHTLDDCALCPQGFFQNTTGLFFCYPCPVDKTTRQAGARSQSVCYNDCPLGQELAENGTCTSCNMGFYKPSGETLCGPCPAGLVTNHTGADNIDDCNVADNQPGYYRLRPDETQSAPCPIGTYQPNKWQYDCVSCGGQRYRTDTMAATSKTQCKFFCPAGQERDGNQDLCRPCDIGMYRTGVNPYSGCENCPNNTRTMTTGATDVSACAIYKCSPGYRPTDDQQSCEKCPRGFYQPLPDQTDCLQCMGAMMDTRYEGAMLQTECERYCQPGYQKLENGTCTVCPIGFYKDNAVDNFHECTRCPDTRYVTSGPGATSQTDCTVLDCPAGHRINGNVCEKCPQGTFQDQPYQHECVKCPPLHSTRFNTSTSETQCETFCEPGREKLSNPERCQICPRGYYKNNVRNVFMDCTLCPPQYVTPSLGSVSQGECTVRNCTEGQYISGNDCLLCDFGYYQPERWQTSCIKCPTDRTTQRNGAVNESECILSCPPGKENQPGSNICTECQQGTYKSIEAAALCDPCPVGYVTRINGSTDVSDCELSACEAGSYASDRSVGGCTSCPFGQYQPDRWQEQCIPCPPGFTTFQRGAVSRDLCLRDCPPGQQYANSSQTCEQCTVGYYNDDLDPARYTCIMCPQEYITATAGATSSRDCNIKNCTEPGQYRDPVANECKDCLRGQWQNRKWQTSCEPCEVGLTTRFTGTTKPEDCLFDCPNGQQLGDDGECGACPVGQYRNKADSWECQPCPDGLTTPGGGSMTRADCSISTCQKGHFFNTDSQVQRCQQCGHNSYQDQSGQFLCKPCPERTETRLPGATQASDCIDKCQTNSNKCHQNARCASTREGVTCVCNKGFVGDGLTCTNMCDVEGYCQNALRCDKDRLQCVCKDNYIGETCQQRKDPKAAGLGDKDIIIVAVVTTVAFLLFLLLLIVCCCVLARKRQRNKAPFPHETSDERASIATRMSTRGFDDFGAAGPAYSSKGHPPFPGPANPRMMLPAQTQQVFEHTTYTMSDGDPAVYKA